MDAKLQTLLLEMIKYGGEVGFYDGGDKFMWEGDVVARKVYWANWLGEYVDGQTVTTAAARS